MGKTFSARSSLINPRAGTRFSYDATETTSRRRAPKTVIKSGDEALPPQKRKTLVATTEDARRNFAVFRWALGKHLDFVVAHNFKSRSGDRDFDRKLEKFVRKLSTKERFDVTGRHPLRRWLRLFEASRVVWGDCLAVRIAGGYQQAIEGDRIKDPPFEKIQSGENWIQGLRVSSFGSVDRYSIHKRRAGGGSEFEKKIDASRAFYFGYFDRFDQYRGISPMASAINMLVSLDKGIDYALAKNCISQLLAFAIYRNAELEIGYGYGGDDLDDEEREEPTPYKFDVNRGINFLDMDRGDRAEFIESKSPAGETQNFWRTVTSIALKAIDIPYSFYDEKYTNFFGSRAALNLYLKSVEPKREDVRDYLDDWTSWRLGYAQAFGEFDFPAGWSPDPDLWAWVPTGFPWWNPAQEIQAAEKAIALKLRSRTEIRKETYGDDWLDVVDEIDGEDRYLEEKRQARKARRAEAGSVVEDPDETEEEATATEEIEGGFNVEI